MIRARHGLGIAVVVLAAIPGIAEAQAETNGAISGKVVDEGGSPIRGATATATSVEYGLERETTTDHQGLFYLGLLPVGHYSVSVTAAGFQPQVYSFRLGVGQNVPVEATLLRGQPELREEIVVRAPSAAMRTATTGINLDYRDTVEELPIADRNINLVPRLAPQVFDGRATRYSLVIAGAPSLDTVMLLDGAEISDPIISVAERIYLEDAIEEVQVLTSGISARYGRFQGGVVNAITKSGSNDYEATFRYEFHNESWNERTPFGETQIDETNETFQLTGGGYLAENRAWWFGGYREIPAKKTGFVTTYTGDAFVRTDTEERWQIKLRGAPAPSHVIDVSHLEFEDGSQPGVLSVLLPAHLDALPIARSWPFKTNSVSYQAALTQKLFLEFQATEKQLRFVLGGDPAGGHPFLDFTNFTVYNNYWWDPSDQGVRDNETAAVNLTYTLETARAGTHSLQAGIQRVSSILGGQGRNSVTGLSVVGINPDFVGPLSAHGEPSFNLENERALRLQDIDLTGDQEIESLALYLQDTVTLGDWRLDLGLRWDDYEGSGPQSEFRVGFDDLAVRLGLTYDVTDRLQATATWGEYVSRLNDGIVNDATAVGTGPTNRKWYSGPSLTGLTAAEVEAIIADDSQWLIQGRFLSPEVMTTYLDNNLRPPVAVELGLSLRYVLPRNSGTLVLNYIDRDFNDLLDDYVGGVCDYEFLEFDHPDPCPAANLTVFRAPSGNVTGVVDTRVWANNPRARREYQGLSLQADYRPSTSWGVGGSYTHSRMRGNYEGQSESGFGGPVGTLMGDYMRSRPEEGVDVFGDLLPDVRNRLRAWGQYRSDFRRGGKLALSGLLSYSTGAHWNRQAEVRLTDDPEYVLDSGTQTRIFSRGADEFENLLQFDLGARWEVPLRGKLRLWLKTTVLNLFDRDAVLSHQTGGLAVVEGAERRWTPLGNCGPGDAPSPSCTGFGRITGPRSYQSPRQFFFTLGLRY